jgi:hypothetical protein
VPALDKYLQRPSFVDTGIMGNWLIDYLWGVPLIVLTVVVHAYGLQFLNRRVSARISGAPMLRHQAVGSTIVIGGTVLLLTVLHGIECVIWASAYRFLGALRDNQSAMLYSLNAMTSYGHEVLTLPFHLQMMGAMEALDGWILFGLTTAFLFNVVQSVWTRA